jgi:hypothetical protein
MAEEIIEAEVEVEVKCNGDDCFTGVHEDCLERKAQMDYELGQVCAYEELEDLCRKRAGDAFAIGHFQEPKAHLYRNLADELGERAKKLRTSREEKSAKRA